MIDNMMMDPKWRCKTEDRMEYKSGDKLGIMDSISISSNS